MFLLCVRLVVFTFFCVYDKQVVVNHSDEITIKTIKHKHLITNIFNNMKNRTLFIIAIACILSFTEANAQLESRISTSRNIQGQDEEITMQLRAQMTPEQQEQVRLEQLRLEQERMERKAAKEAKNREKNSKSTKKC